jgi:hypothetical protein
MGLLQLFVNEAIFDRDLTTFLTMSPRFNINYKEEIKEIGPAWDGGKTPNWGSETELDIGDDPESRGVITFTFLNEDDLICSSEVQVSELISKRGGDHWYKCRFEGEDAGTFSMRAEYDISQDEVAEEPVEEAAAPEQPAMDPMQMQMMQQQQPGMMQ